MQTGGVPMSTLLYFQLNYCCRSPCRAQMLAGSDSATPEAFKFADEGNATVDRESFRR